MENETIDYLEGSQEEHAYRQTWKWTEVDRALYAIWREGLKRNKKLDTAWAKWKEQNPEAHDKLKQAYRAGETSDITWLERKLAQLREQLFPIDW